MFDEKCTPFTNTTQNIGATILVGKTKVGPTSVGIADTSIKCEISLTICDNLGLTQTTYENVAWA